MSLMQRLSCEPHAVHVWLWGGQGATEKTMALRLSHEERCRAEAFRSGAARSQFLQGRFMLRTLLGKYLGPGAAQASLSIGAYGKPDFSAPVQEGLRFNISHDSCGIAVAFCLGQDVGVDVETLPEGYQLDDVITQHFNADEQASLMCSDEFGFVDIWAAKEAVLKATGEGITGCLRDVGVVQRRANRYGFASNIIYRGEHYRLCRQKLGHRALAVSARVDNSRVALACGDVECALRVTLFHYQDFY